MVVKRTFKATVQQVTAVCTAADLRKKWDRNIKSIDILEFIGSGSVERDSVVYVSTMAQGPVGSRGMVVVNHTEKLLPKDGPVGTGGLVIMTKNLKNHEGVAFFPINFLPPKNHGLTHLRFIRPLR